MSSEDLRSYERSSVDFYELLDIPLESSQKELDRAWRRTALRYHPDKVGADPVAKEKFHLAQIGYDLLSNAMSKQIYDNARNARLQQQRHREQYNARRREMMDNLEARERGVKRSWRETRDEGPMDAQAKFLKELERLEAEGRRRRKEREEALRKDLGKAEEEGRQVAETGSTPNANGDSIKSSVSELDRSVQVRWPSAQKEGARTATEVKDLFSKFGEIENATLLATKRIRLEKSKKKQEAVRCLLVYKSIVAAHAAVEDFDKQRGPQWQGLDSIQWAQKKEPDILSGAASNGTRGSGAPDPASRASLHRSAASRRFDGSPDIAQTEGNASNERPAFHSFSAAPKDTPMGSSFGKGAVSTGLSLEELTMIRLRKMEQKRLAAEIKRRDDQPDAANTISVDDSAS